MRSKPITFSENLPETYRDTLLIQSFLKEGDVDFGKSDTKSEPCKTYVISHEHEGVELELTTKNCEEEVLVESVEKTKS
jgi:hypothetical protein